MAASAIDKLSETIQQSVQNGHNAEGLAAAQKMEQLVRRQQGTDNTNYAGALNNQGVFLNNLGRYPEAAEKFRMALEIKLRKAADPASIMRTSQYFANVLVFLSRTAEAKAVAERALQIGTQAFGPDDPRLAGSLSALGSLEREEENFKDSARYFERALAIRQNAANPEPVSIAESMDDLGDLYGLEGRFVEGEKLLLQALKVMDGISPGRASVYAKYLNDLGNLYKDAGRLPEAEAAFGRALTMLQDSLGDQHPNFAATMGNLALVLSAMSRNVEAENLYKRTLLIYEKIYGPTDAITAVGLNNLANVYSDESRHAEAMGLQQRVLAIREKISGPDSADTARALGNLANSYEDLGRSDEAGVLYKRALRIMTQKFGEDSGPTATALSAVGLWERDHGSPDDARRDFERALTIGERVLGPQHPEIANSLRNVAFLDIKAGRFNEARAGLERALDVAEMKLGPRHRITLATMVNLAEVAGKQERWPDALVLLRRAAEENTGRIATSVKSNTLPGESFPDLDNALIAALWHVASGKPDSSMTDEAFRAAQRAYQAQASAALAQMAARFGAGNDAIAAAVRRQQDLRSSLETLEKKVTAELGAADGKRNDALINSLRNEAARAQKSYSELTAQIDRDFPTYAELSSPAPLSIGQVQALLKPDEALVSYVSTGEQGFVFAVTRDRSAWQRIALDAGAISDRVTRLRAGLFNPDPNAAGPAPFDLAASHELYAALLGPIEGDIASKPKLLIVPVRALTSLPFQVLVTKPPDPAVALDDRYRKAAWLVNDKAITVLPAVSSLRALRSFARASRATKPFIGFGDPVFQRDSGSKGGNRPASRSLQPYRSYYKGALVDYDMLRQALPALPDTADELRAVASALGAPASDVRLGAAASVSNVMTASLNQYRVVDFATHGLVAGQVDGLSEPALVLSMPDQPTAEDDGLLTAGRVAKLNLDADWAVLSACNTAAGNTPGAEGLSGLARAFFYAGARSLLVSHWPLESDAAVKLTTGAFSEIAKNPSIGRAEALRRSMRAFIADGPTRNADPSVWAPFVLVGEGS